MRWKALFLARTIQISNRVWNRGSLSTAYVYKSVKFQDNETSIKVNVLKSVKFRKYFGTTVNFISYSSYNK